MKRKRQIVAHVSTETIKIAALRAAVAVRTAVRKAMARCDDLGAAINAGDRAASTVIEAAIWEGIRTENRAHDGELYDRAAHAVALGFAEIEGKPWPEAFAIMVNLADAGRKECAELRLQVEEANVARAGDQQRLFHLEANTDRVLIADLVEAVEAWEAVTSHETIGAVLRTATLIANRHHAAALNRPCSNCPFKIGGINTTPENARELVRLATSDEAHPCHQTVTDPILLPCRGARLFRENLVGGEHQGIFRTADEMTAAKNLGVDDDA